MSVRIEALDLNERIAHLCLEKSRQQDLAVDDAVIAQANSALSVPGSQMSERNPQRQREVDEDNTRSRMKTK
jgi:hypothetical protein